MSSNSNLHHAKRAKNDEFYTLASDIEKELCHYRDAGHFRGKTIFLNCDDPTESEFWRYFHLNFGFFGLKKLISTHYDPNEPTYKLEYEGGNDNDYTVGKKTRLRQNGDFRSEECLELLDECDMVVTNPPWSLFREHLAILVEHGKQFIIIGNKNAITYKEVFPLLKDNKVWLGYTSPSKFMTPDGMSKKVSGLARWYTNLDVPKRHERIDLFRRYSPRDYPRYDNYDAIEVSKVSNIPCDYVPSWFVTNDEADTIDEREPGLWERARRAIMSDDWVRELPLTDENGDDTVGGVHGWFVLPSKASPLRAKMSDEDGDGEVWEHLATLIGIERERENNAGATVSSASQSLSLIDTQGSSSSSSDSTGTLMTTRGTGTASQSEGVRRTHACSSSRFCDGAMGIPVTFVDAWSPSQFVLVDADFNVASPEPLPDSKNGTGRFYVTERERERLHGVCTRAWSFGGRCEKRSVISWCSVRQNGLV